MTPNLDAKAISSHLYPKSLPNATMDVGSSPEPYCNRVLCPRSKPPNYSRDGVTEELQAIISYPIYEPPRRGRQSGRLIGVLTLDSKTPNAYTLLTSDPNGPLIAERMERIAIVASQIYH